MALGKIRFLYKDIIRRRKLCFK